MIIKGRDRANATDINSYYSLNSLINLSDKDLRRIYGDRIEDWYYDVSIRIDKYFSDSKGKSNSRFSKIKLQENYDILYNNKFDMSKYKDILQPYSSDIENILEIEHYDILTTRLNVLVGEELLRPEMYKVVNMSEKNSKWLKDKRKKILMEVMNIFDGEELNEEGLPTDPSKQIEIREKVELLNSDFISKFEQIINSIFKYLYHRDNFKQIENEALYTYLGTGYLIFKVYEKGNDVKFRYVNPTLIDLDLKYEVNNVSDSFCFREVRYLNFNELIDEYGDYLTSEDINYLLNDKTQINNLDYLKSYSFQWSNSNILRDNTFSVVEYEFKRVVRAKEIKIVDEEGEEHIELFPIDFKIPEELGAIEREVNITEIHTIVKINNDVYIKMGKLKPLIRDMDNYNQINTSYNGIVTSFNLLEKVKKLQGLYNLVMYFLKKEMIRAKGKVFIMDIAQIPKSYGWDIEKWLYYLDVFGLVGINSLESNDLNLRPTFNQFQQIDLSLGNTINSYIMQLETIKKEVIEILGVSQQRIGMVKSTETLGGIERSVTQSIAITEPILEFYRKGFKNALQSTINLIKYVYPKNKKISFTNEFGAKEIIEINDDDFFLQSYGIVVTDSKKFKGVIDFLQEHSRNLLMNSGISTDDYIRIIKSNSIEEINIILRGIEQRRQEMQQQQQQIQQQELQIKSELEKMKLESEIEYKKQLIEIEKMKLELEREKIILSSPKEK